MEFFDRTYEIGRLQQIRELSKKSAQLTVVTGRRRIGKTSMIIKALEGENFLYVFVTKGTEKELCRDMAQEMKLKLKLPLVGDVSRMEDLLALFLLTGGVAKYVEHLMDHGATDRETMLRTVVDKDSVFLLEGKSLLIEEFGRDYGRYFDILKLIAEGHNSRSDLEGILGVEISGHLSRLENDYGILAKTKPLLQKSNNRNIRYRITDHFVRFWFRFFYKYNTFIEANAFEQLRTVVERDYTTYSGRVLEDFFKQRLRELGRYTLVGSWWDRRGENEIDIIAADDLAKRVTFFEVKRQRKEIDLAVLRSKAQHFLQATGAMRDYDVEYRGLCLEDVINGDGSR